MKVTLTRPNVYETEGVRLLPGINDVPDAKMAKFTANKIVQKDIDAGVIVIHHSDKAAPVVAVDAPADDAPAVDVDTDALIEIAQGDGRKKAVQEARDTLEAMGVAWDE